MLYVVAIKVDSTAESPLEKPPEFLAQLEGDATKGSRVELTRNFLNATFFTSIEDAREGVKKVLGVTPTTNYRGQSWPEGFHIRSGLHLTYDSPQRSGEVGIYPVKINGKVAIGDPIEASYVEAELTELNPVKASRIPGVFKYTFTGSPSARKAAFVRPQLEFAFDDQHFGGLAPC